MLDAAGQSAADWCDRDMARIARRLHDRIGPALCAAGLQLSLVEQSAPPPPRSPAAEAFRGLREALSCSTDEVRTLSYLCDPSLVERLGLKTAFGYLARAVPIDPIGLAGLPARKDPAAARSFRLLRSGLLYWAECAPEANFVVAGTSRSLRVTSTSPATEELAAYLRQSGAAVPASRLSATWKIPAGQGEARQ